MNQEKSTDIFLDITTDVCPLTFVRAKLCVERMNAGQTVEVRLSAGEPLENVPRSLQEIGHEIVDLRPENPDRPDGPHRLRVRKR